MSQLNFILSPCGISLLLNVIESSSDREIITKHANAKTEKDIPLQDQQRLKTLLEQARSKLLTENLEQVSKLSAELNGITKFYAGTLTKHTQDCHWLLCTDTWLGTQVSNFIKDWLVQHGYSNTNIYSPRDLQTKDIHAFQSSLSYIVNWCEETIKPYLETHHVVFNLTGGFKSVQGFLQTLATFYAHESVYVFESSKDLLRIPQLPVKMNLTGVIKDNLTVFRKFVARLSVQPEEVANIPETLLLKIEEEIALSTWGELVWQQTYREIYSEEFCQLPTEKIKIGEKFRTNIKGLDKERLIMLNERMDQLTRHLHDRNYNPKSLDFKQLKGTPSPPSTHELDAWADGDAKRIYGHFDPKDIFILDKLGKHL